MIDMTTAAGLWLAVFISGVYHGVNPGMGWPLAVSAALFSGRRRDLYRALGLLGVGHLAAMLAILLPFALLSGLIRWQEEIQTGAAILVIAAGVYLLINRRHPRALARIAPHRLMLWSFAIAMAHGAGLMLAPIYLGLCRIEPDDAGHVAAADLIGVSLPMALIVATFHAIAMIVAGGAVAVAVHAWLGLKFLQKSWFNLDVVWALSLIAVGVAALLLAH